MKKALKIMGVIVLLLVVLIIALPVIFKGKIFEMIQEEADKNLTAQVEIQDIGLSLIENFPDFTLTIEGLKVTGKEGEFTGVELANIEEIKAALDVMSVINGDQIEIHTVGLTRPNLHVIVLKDGTANYDIVKASEGEEEPEEEEAEEVAEEPDGEAAPLNVQINEYYIREAHVIYDDRQGGMYAELENFTHEGRGDFTLDEFLFETRTTADAINFRMDGTDYLKDVRTDITFNFQMDMVNSKYTFMENEVNLNDLSLAFDGWVQMPDEAIDMDLTFGTKQTEFKSILSLVPDAYTQDFSDVKTAGSLALKGMTKGRFAEEGESMQLPAFDVSLLVKDAMFQYPDLPESAENINIDIRAQNPGGSEDATLIDVNQFHVELAKNPIDLVMHVKTPVSDPDIDGTIQAQINLASLGNVIPVEEGESYSGSITSDIRLKGQLSAIEEERYEDFQADGKLIILDLDYESPELPYDVFLKKLYLEFSPKFVELTNFEATVGQSDLAADGRIDNMLAYYFKDDALTGTFNMRSNYLNLNEFMTEEEEVEGDSEETAEEGEAEGTETETPADSASSGVFEVPGNINFTLTTAIQKLIYDNMEITDLKGKIVMADQKIDMENLSMNLLDGALGMSGSYATVNPSEPEVDFDLDISRFDVEKTVTTFNTVEKLAPILKSAKGAFSTKMTLAGKMDDRMEMKMESINGGGRLKTHKVRVENETLEKIDKAVKVDKFNPLELNDVDIDFEIKDGRVETKPFEVEQGGVNNTIYGYTTLEQQINYTIDSDVPTELFGSQASELAGSLLSQVKGLGIDAGDLPATIKVSTSITGDMSDPKIKPNFGGGKGKSGSAKEKIKDTAKEALNKAKDEMKLRSKEEADKIMADAQKEADKLVKEASKQADKIRAEGKNGADQLRKEADKQANELVKEAKNPLAKIAAEKGADKIRKEADKKAQRLEDEANKKADQTEAKAQEQADKIMENARKRAEQKLNEDN